MSVSFGIVNVCILFRSRTVKPPHLSFLERGKGLGEIILSSADGEEQTSSHCSVCVEGMLSYGLDHWTTWQLFNVKYTVLNILM